MNSITSKAQEVQSKGKMKTEYKSCTSSYTKQSLMSHHVTLD
jgi:hypothetical protein